MEEYEMKHQLQSYPFSGYFQKRHRERNTYPKHHDDLRSSGVAGMVLYFFVLLIITYHSPVTSATLFVDDFESGTLDNWVIGGRQLAGPNIADVVTRHGSQMGHLYKYSFTEINFTRTFAYEADLGFYFDMETIVTSQSPPGPAYYGMASADFLFLDTNGTELGLVRYASATTPYIFSVYDSDPTRDAVQITGSGLQHYSLDVIDLLSLIAIDEAAITDVLVRFNAYSSTYPYPAVSAELWVDNFSTVPLNNVPLPPALYLFGAGLFALIKVSRKSYKD